MNGVGDTRAGELVEFPLSRVGLQPFWEKNQDSNRFELVSTYTREVAGFTCQTCPQPFRRTAEVVTHYSKYGDYSTWVVEHTSRCTECHRLMKRWQRGRLAGDRLKTASLMMEQDISFITLTLPNYQSIDPHEGVRDLKKKVAAFRSKFPVDVVSGGYDFYEWTTLHGPLPEGTQRTWNVHHHGLWVMDYWNQREMQSAWSHGIVHLFRITGKAAHEKTIQYATKYASKADVKGIRLRQSFGCLYGTARVALETAYAVRQEQTSSDVEDVVG